jgi:hypothetical protein
VSLNTTDAVTHVYYHVGLTLRRSYIRYSVSKVH